MFFMLRIHVMPGRRLQNHHGAFHPKNAKPRATAEAWIPGDQTRDANSLVHDVEPERSWGLGMLKVWGWEAREEGLRG